MIEQIAQSLNLIVLSTQQNYILLASIVGILFFAYFLTLLTQHRLLILGIIPRHILGLPGIFFAPFLHANSQHLFFNTIPLLVLSDFMLLNGQAYFFIFSFAIIVFSGTLIWLFGNTGIHIGASAVVTGYWGFLVVNAYYTHSVTSIILALICVYYFMGIFYGVFPGKKGVSWQGHLFGLAAGVTVSYWQIPIFKIGQSVWNNIS